MIALKCSVAGCDLHGTWKTDGLIYCSGHVREVLMNDDRDDFAQEYADGAREFDELDWSR